MNRTMPLVIIILSIILVTSLACSLVSQLESQVGEAAPAPAEPATGEAESTAPQEAEDAQSEGASDDSDGETAPTGAGSAALVPPPPVDQSTEAGACANTFFPMIPGYQWIYEVTSEGETSQISLSVSEVMGNQATLNALYLETGITTEATVECADGAILNFPVMLLGFLFGDVDGELTVEHVDGVYAPNYSTLDNHNWDYSWTGEYLASGTVDAVIEGDQVTGRLAKSPVDMEWNTLGEGQAIFEAITVKAGEYPRAIKLERELTFDLEAEMEESGYTVSVEAVLILQNNLWFEPNVGQLKQEIERASIEVYGVNFPLEMTGTVELVEFRTQE